MTQAFNLSQFANSVDSSGKASLTTGVVGTLPLANGGTGASNTVNTVVAGSGISVSTSGTQVTVNATGGGTVTSVATGNGLQGGTITSTGTLSVACPGYNTVGSYVFGTFGNWSSGSAWSITSGSNYATGYSNASILSTVYSRDSAGYSDVANLSGTWKYMGATRSGEVYYLAIGCRVS